MMADGGFNSKSIGLSVQKKVLTKLGTRNTVKNFISDEIAQLLDNVYHLCKDYTKSKQKAEKLISNIIKMTIKVGLLYRNNKFSPDELKLADRFQKKFHTMIMTFTSFYSVDFTYDRAFLAKHINECCSLLTQLVAPHLKEKSSLRIKSIFQFFSDDNFLDTLFEKDCPLRKQLDPIVAALNRLIEKGEI
ncbi:tumor necrosis factor alpha-induced protein 8-like protein isoform X2 [Amphiura filiformis]|uniref:tumor necrosis factor alpha-induced protein 8-like protein isoform X2 n=1 Tax=Amphiura filiformis TaxID=82378 RepID=UPI003B2154E5